MARKRYSFTNDMIDEFRFLKFDALSRVQDLEPQDPLQGYFGVGHKNPFQRMDFTLFQAVKEDLCLFLRCRTVTTLIKDAMEVACAATGHPGLPEGTPIPPPQPFKTQSLKLSSFPQTDWEIACRIFVRNFEQAAFYLEERTRPTFISGVEVPSVPLPLAYRLGLKQDDIDTSIRVKSLILRSRLASMHVAGTLKQ